MTELLGSPEFWFIAAAVLAIVAAFEWGSQ